MEESGYGLWFLVALNSAILIVFAASFFHPRTQRDWRAMGAFSAFIVALFTEMYGVPPTVYLLSGWLGERFPALQATHAGGHLWNDLIGWRFDPHFSPFHLASYVFIIGGFWLISSAWKVLWEAHRNGTLAVSGPMKGSASPIRGLPSSHGGIPAAVADDSHVGDVPGLGGVLPAPCGLRGKRRARALRERLDQVRRQHASVPAEAKRLSHDQPRPAAPRSIPEVRSR